MAAAARARQGLHLPKPAMRTSGRPSPVLKLAWHRRHTYIFELDIIVLAPCSTGGLAAEYSACVCRSFWAEPGDLSVLALRVVMASGEVMLTAPNDRIVGGSELSMQSTCRVPPRQGGKSGCRSLAANP